MREMNAQMIQGKDFDAFPHQGVTPQSCQGVHTQESKEQDLDR